MKQLLVQAICVLVLSGCGRTDAPTPSMVPASTSAATPASAPLARQQDVALQPVPEWLKRAQPESSLICYLDVAEGARRGANEWRVRAGEAVRVSGWAVEPGTVEQRGAHLALLAMDGSGRSWFFRAERSDRPDVTESPRFVSLKPSHAGLASSFMLTGIEPGSYELSYVVGDDGKAGSCSLGPANTFVIE